MINPRIGYEDVQVFQFFVLLGGGGWDRGELTFFSIKLHIFAHYGFSDTFVTEKDFASRSKLRMKIVRFAYPSKVKALRFYSGIGIAPTSNKLSGTVSMANFVETDTTKTLAEVLKTADCSMNSDGHKKGVNDYLI